MINILVAEDDKFLASAYRVKMTKKGWGVAVVTEGQEVLNYLKDQTPDLILLDLIMPEMDGFSVMEQINQDINFKKIPILVASNLGQKEDIDKAMRLGAKDFIIKSDTQLEDVIIKIEKILKEYGSIQN